MKRTAASPMAVRSLLLVLPFTLVAAMSVMLTQATSRAAGSMTVNSTGDANTPGDGLCTLREAISNSNAGADTSGGDCAPGTGDDNIAFSVSGAITPSSDLPPIQNTLTIDATGQAITIDGTNSFLIFTVNSAATLSLNHLAVAIGHEGASNGGTLTITDTTFTGNSGSVVIFNLDSGALTVNGCTFANTFLPISNSGTATVTGTTFSHTSGGLGGGAISSSNDLRVSDSFFSEGTASRGGAIYCQIGTTTVSNSTFSGNFAASNGGAIAVGVDSPCTLTVVNSTFSGNNALGLGGAIYNGGAGTITITNNTLSGNSAGSAGGGIDNQSASPAAVTVANSILAGNTGGSCGGTSVIDGGHNIDDGATCAFTGSTCAPTTGTSFCNTNPHLDPAGLADNGGPTTTIALQADSPAINAGDNAICAAPPVSNLDQRGFTRPGTGATNCSIGAYEFNGQSPSGPTNTPTLTQTGGPTPTGTPTETPTAIGTLTATLTGTPTPSRTPTVPPTSAVTTTPTASPTSTPASSIDLGTGVGQPGGIACIPATLFTAGAGIAATTNDVAFSQALLSVDSCTINPLIGAGTAPNKGVSASITASGEHVTVSGPTAAPIPDGLLYTCQFRLDSSLALGSIPLGNTPGAVDTAGNPVAVNGAAGQILVTTCTGDCNGNGNVTIGEVTKCINLFLGAPLCNSAAPAASCPAADANGNGVVTIGEVTQCVNRFLGGCS